MEEYYLWIKSFHVIFVIAWMAGLLYLPRIFAYHSEAKPGSDMDQTFKVMEKKLLRIIMNPAMILTFTFGGILVHIFGLHALGIWFHMKLTLVLIMTILHGFMAKWRKDFENNTNTRNRKFYAMINEVPAFIMILIVILVIVKPFE